MKHIKQFSLILCISFISEVLHELILLPIPACIYGIIILFVCLETKVIPVSAVKETSMFLIEIMPIMFVPAAVGLLESWEILKASWIAYILITVISTFAVMIISGKVTQNIIRHKTEENKNE